MKNNATFVVFTVIFSCFICVNTAVAENGVVFVDGSGYSIPSGASYTEINKAMENELQTPGCLQGNVIWMNFDVRVQIAAVSNSEQSNVAKNALRNGSAGCTSKLSDQELNYLNNKSTPAVNTYQNQEPEIRLPKTTNCTTIGGITNCTTY